MTRGSPCRRSGVRSAIAGGRQGGQAEGTLTSKGYTYRGGTKLEDSSFTFWEQPSTNNCVTIRTTDGRYQSITYTKRSDCN